MFLSSLYSKTGFGKIILLILLLVNSCKKETVERHSKTFTIVYYDSFGSKAVEGIEVILTKTVYGGIPFIKYLRLDTFQTDSDGRISFVLGPEDLEELEDFSLSNLSVPEQYLSTGSLYGPDFWKFEQGMTVNIKPACFLEIREIDIFPMGSKSCDFYFLDVKFQNFNTSIISWASGMPVRSSKQYHKFRPGLNDTFRARFGCASYRDTTVRVISTYPYDTVVMSDYFHP